MQHWKPPEPPPPTTEGRRQPHTLIHRTDIVLPKNYIAATPKLQTYFYVLYIYDYIYHV